MKKDIWSTVSLVIKFCGAFLPVLFLIFLVNNTGGLRESDLSPFLMLFLSILIIPCVLLGIFLLGLCIENARKKKVQDAILNTGFQQVDRLSPFDFEEWIASFLRVAGYKAKVTKKSGDYGVDVIAEKEHDKIAIQVKKYTKPVGIKPIQEVYTGKEYYGCNDAWVMTTAPYFTQAAKNLASIHNVKLFNKEDLILFLNQIQEEKNKE